MDSYLRAWKQYAVFDGRDTRREFWLFVLVDVVVVSLLSTLDAKMRGTVGLTDFYSVAMFIPRLAATTRRLHDTGHRGWLLMVPLYNLWLLVQAGEPRANRFGPDVGVAPQVA